MSVYLVELGALNVRLGNSTSRTPLATFLNKAVALPHSRLLEEAAFLFGEEAELLQPGYPCLAPLRDGRVAHWPALLGLLEHLLTRMGLVPDPQALPFDRAERRLQLVTGLGHPAADFERLCAFLFEARLVDELSFSPSAVNALYYSGNVTGLVVDAGHDAVRALPVVEGFSDRRWLRSSPFAGAALSRAVAAALRGPGEEPLCREAVLQHVKQSHAAFLAEGGVGPQRCALPDGGELLIRSELRPALEEFYGLGAHPRAGLLGAVVGCLDRFDQHTRANLALKLLPTGGSACLAGFDAVLARELPLRSRLRFELVGNDDRLQAAYKGSHDLMELRSAVNPFISRREFEESGLQIILKKVKFC